MEFVLINKGESSSYLSRSYWQDGWQGMLVDRVRLVFMVVTGASPISETIDLLYSAGIDQHTREDGSSYRDEPALGA